MYLPRPSKEVEAESVAFVVASAHGMSTGDYSFPYVASWAGEDGAKAVQATQLRVARAARQIIEASPAPHAVGGKVPGVEAAITAAQSRRAELEARLVAHTHRRPGRGDGVMPDRSQTPMETPPTLTLVQLPDPVVERLGHRPGSPYVELVWLGVLGPSTTFAWQRLARQAVAVPCGNLDVADLSLSLGLGEGLGRNAMMSRTLARLVAFDVARASR